MTQPQEQQPRNHQPTEELFCPFCNESIDRAILREIGTTAPSEIELIAKFVRYKQARPFASRWNAGQWAVDIQNAAKYLGISGETVQALDIAWDRSGCK